MSQLASPLPEFRSSPLRAFQSLFESPNWPMNVLWLTLAALSQGIFIGQIALFGWCAQQLSVRSGRPEYSVPDIDPQQLGEYLTKGIWPFLMSFLMQLGVSVLAALPGAAFFALGAFGQGELAGSFMFVLLFLLFPVTLLLAILLSLLIVPLLLRAMVCQDLKLAFDLDWARKFLRIMFWDMLAQGLIFAVLALGVVTVGMLALCVGYLPAVGIILGAWTNLLAQWYEVYLSRGGEPAPPPPGDPYAIDATVVQ